MKKPVPFFQRPEQPKASEVVFLEPVSMSVGDLAAKCTEMQRLYFPQGINMQLPKRMIGKQKGDLHEHKPARVGALFWWHIAMHDAFKRMGV